MEGINDLFTLGFKHRTVNHSKWIKGPFSLRHSNTIEINMPALNKTIPPKCRNAKYIDVFIDKLVIKRVR